MTNLLNAIVFLFSVLFQLCCNSTVSAGLVSKFVDGPIADKASVNKPGTTASASLKAQEKAVQGLGFSARVGRNLRAAAINTATSTAANGGKVARNALSAATGAMVDAGAASVAQEIGRAYRNGAGDMSWLTHKVCHFVLGGGSAALRGEDPLAGAIGATIGEVVADAMIARALEQTRADVLEQLDYFRDTYGTLPPVQDAEALVRLTYLEHLEAEQADQIQRIGRLAAAGTAFIGRMDIPVADAAADLAIEYNSIGSQIENLRNWIGEHYRVAQVWLDEHEFISIFVPGSLWVSLEGKVNRGEKLTTTDIFAAGLNFIPVVGNISAKGTKALVIKKCSQKTIRRVATLEDLNKYVKGFPAGTLGKGRVTTDGHKCYEILKNTEYKGRKFKKGDFISEDRLHNEIEWFRGKDTHKGAIDVFTGEVYKKPVSGRVLKIK